MRIHRPIPILLIIFPILIIICGEFLLDIQNKRTIDFDYFLMIGKLVIVSCIGSILVRSLGCVINDFFDKDIDKKTERAKIRPLVDDLQDKRDKPTTIGILILSAFFGIISLFLAFSLGKTPTILSICAAILIISYPLTKRIFMLPQLFLGITYNFGIIIICSSMDGWLNFPCLLFFLINIIWTFSYDTIYAMQDLEDDRKNEVNSSALIFETKLIPVIRKLYNAILILLIIFSIFIGGKLIYVSILLLFRRIKRYISYLEQTNNYQKFFENNWRLFGILFMGVLSDLLIIVIVNFIL